MSNLAEFRAQIERLDWASPGGPPPPMARSSAPAAVAASRRKRAFDICFAVAALILFLPLLLTLAALIRLETPGPALFRQRRTGLDGKIFTVFKFRTMTVTEDGAAVRQATRGDARVTALGAVLRRFSLDELPQILNVLRGEMSLIGPRPHALAHDESWSKSVPGYAHRFRARPGLTGWAAVNGYRGEIHELSALVARVEADNEYIDTWSFALDMKILLKTLPLIFTDSNAY